MEKVTVLGAGSWGTALSKLLSEKGIRTFLWARNEELCESLKKERENRRYLPGFRLPEGLFFTSDLEEAASHSEAIIFVVPSHGMRQAARKVKKALSSINANPRVICSCAKGIENETLLLMTEVLKEELPDHLSSRLSVLSGPSFAREVAQRMPTAVTVAAFNEEVSGIIQDLFGTDFFRVYSTQDVVGVQLGGAVKNCLAIAAGISDGLGFGTNTRAALITRGLAEMSRLGLKLGANPLTFAGLAGLGDLVLTCTGDLSRNRQVGLRLGKGEGMEEILSSMKMVAEGVKTSKSIFNLSKKYQVDMPITAEVYKVIWEGKSPKDAVKTLLERPPKPELHGVI